MTVKYPLFVIFAILVTTSAIGKSFFEIGMHQVGERKFTSAIKSFELELKKDSLQPAVYFNIANCYYELEHFPEAIYYYEKVLKLAPLDNEAEISIQNCYGNLNNGTTWKPGMNSLERFIYSVKPFTWGIGSIVSAILSSCLIFFFLARKGNTSRSLFAIGIFGYCITCFLLLAEYHTSHHLSCTYQAINLDSKTQIFSASGKKSSQVLPIGSKVIHIKSFGTFTLVELMNKERVRILTSSVKWI